MISESHYHFKVLKPKALQITAAMMTEDKITEISCIADDFCKVFLLGVKEVFLEVKEVREVKEVKAITFFGRS